MKRIIVELTDAEWIKLDALARKRSKHFKRTYTMIECLKSFIWHCNIAEPVRYGANK